MDTITEANVAKAKDPLAYDRRVLKKAVEIRRNRDQKQWKEICKEFGKVAEGVMKKWLDGYTDKKGVFRYMEPLAIRHEALMTRANWIVAGCDPATEPPPIPYQHTRGRVGARKGAKKGAKQKRYPSKPKQEAQGALALEESPKLPSKVKQSEFWDITAAALLHEQESRLKIRATAIAAVLPKFTAKEVRMVLDLNNAMDSATPTPVEVQ